MSDADDSGFDKEAERERLREKYEAEQADREAAQQMSDLLLKGATMTNSHCGECGSPIFRSDGQEFCPTCSVEAAEAAETGDGAQTADASATADAPETTDASQPTDATEEEPSPDERLADVISGGSDDDDPGPTGGTSMAERAAASVQSSQRRDPPNQSDDVSDRSSDPDAGRGSATDDDRTPAAPSAPPADGHASLADAQQSLLDAITHHARAATGADPRTATDHLEAASEAAEALAEISPEN